VAKLAASPEELRKRFGPHLQYAPPGGWADESRNPAEKLVKTHCCFCGQQCGIQLKVRDNRVIGFEPWEEFPFNRGKLCPKGVKRYLQSGHPDRLLDPLLRDADDFRKAAWDEALDFTARRIREIQQQHGNDAVAMYGGASLNQSFVDTGSNAIFFNDANAPQCTDTNYTDFYCPGTVQNLSATLQGNNGVSAAVNFSVGNAQQMGMNSPAFTVFPQLAGPLPLTAAFDFGLPFYYGRRVATALESRSTSAGTGPYVAY